MDNRGEPDEAVAIVGIACQFPGARDPAELHHLTLAGGRMFRSVPGLPAQAALLDGWTVPFGDAAEPGPVHKLASETAAQALSDARHGRPDAGHEAGLLATGQRAGLIIASTVPDVSEVARDGFRIGQQPRFPAAAYGDSLHAISAACDTLRAGELDVVIAGGAELGVDQDWLARLAAAGELATGDMRVYDADPAGLLPGDGCGVVVLMRSAEARAAGLPVYAEIAGWASIAQADLAYARAGLNPGEVSLIEGHGAGTADGDLAELAALARLRHGSAAAAALGAVSANIGQTRSAAGVASLRKVVVAMVAGAIPPGTGCVRPHELIESGAARLRVPAAAESWPDGTRLGAVNSLGQDGRSPGPAAGVHLILRRKVDSGPGRGRRRRPAAPLPPSRPTAPGKHSAPAGSAAIAALPATDATEVPLAADSPAVPPAARNIPAPAPPEPGQTVTAGETRQVSDRAWPATIFATCGAEPSSVAATLDVVAGSAEALSDTELRDLARHLAVAARRAAERGAPLRVTVTATGPGQLSAQARRAARLLRQWQPGAATTTLTEPGIGISAGATGTLAVVFPGLAGTVAEHMTLLAASLDGMRLLDRLGVTADSAAGYGFGELAGLVWAGCLPAAEAARLAVLRGQALRACLTRGAALVRVGCDAAQALALGAAGGAQIAVHETPGSYVLAGPSAGIRELMWRASALRIPATVLAGGTAQHYAITGRCAAPLRGVLADTLFGTPRRRLISSITGLPVTPADDIAELLAGQVARPVLFSQALTLAVRRPGRPPADLVVVAGPSADPANPAGPAAAGTAEGQPAATLAGIVTAACGLPALTLPPNATQPTDERLARIVAALFTAGAIGDLAPFLSRPVLDRGQPDRGQPAWTVPPMRAAGPTETSGAAETSSTASSSARRVLMGEHARLLPVGPQRHSRRPVRVQLDTQHLVQLDVVPVKAEP
jgi:enediyne polyketide synthase